MSATNDPFEAATQAAESAGQFYGRCDVSARFIVFPEGGGRPVEFDAAAHDIAKRQTELHFYLTPIDALNQPRPLERKVIAESAEWSKIVWPSLRDGLGFKSAREAPGKFFKVTLVPSGRKPYTNSQGVEVTPTTIKFLAVYNTEDEATAAYEGELGRAVRPVASAPVNGNGNGAMPTNQTALLFLPALVKAANGDLQRLAESLAGNPLLRDYTIDSPEVVALLKAEAVRA